VKDLGPLNFFLGIPVTRSNNGLHLCQMKCKSNLIGRIDMDGAKPTKSSSGSKLSKLYGELLLDPTVYRHIMGALQYCPFTRLEISFSVL